VNQFTRSDFDRVVGFLSGLYEPRTPEALTVHLLSALPALVPVLFAASGSIPLSSAEQIRTLDAKPSEFASAEFDAVVNRCRREFVVFRGPAWRTESRLSASPTTGQFIRRSDLEPFSQFCHTELYNEAYRPLGVKDVCTLAIQGKPGHLEGLAVGLDKQIPDALRDVLVSISKHIVQAFRTAHIYSSLIEIGGMKSDSLGHKRGIMAIDMDGRIIFETATATRAFENQLLKRDCRGLPEQLARWMAILHQTHRNTADVPKARLPLVIERNGTRLSIYLLSTPEVSFLVFDECRSLIDPASLESLGLTLRESEILALIAAGKTDREIGITLGISWRTASKHVEHIFDALGVRSRTAAAAVALKAANL
jgi:DNA-binding NarL/FixJ family response regulator